MTLCNTFWQNIISRLNTFLRGEPQLLISEKKLKFKTKEIKLVFKNTFFLNIAITSKTTSICFFATASTGQMQTTNNNLFISEKHLQLKVSMLIIWIVENNGF